MSGALTLVPLLAGFTVNVGSQILLSRGGLSLLRSIYVGCGLGLLTLLGSHSPDLLTDVVIYASFSYGYFHFINLGETARRIRLLRELAEAGRPLPELEVLRRYNAHTILELRLGRLLRKGQIRRHGDRYVTGRASVLWMARTLSLLQTLLMGRRGRVP